MSSATVPATPEPTESLPTALRSGAARAAELVGGLALIFARDEREQPILRAAAGFASADEARRGSASVEEAASAAMLTGEISRPPLEVSLGERAAAGLLVVPLQASGRIHGALAVGLAQEIADPQTRALETLAESLALRLDHAYLENALTHAQANQAERAVVEEEKSDELLRLSEALFAQDVELLRSNEKLGTVEKLKADFIEKMSRELRTPLNSIIECIISVLAGENENLSTPGQDSLRQALDEGTTFLRTLQNILDLWRVKQGELPVEHQEVNFREVVEEAIFSVQDTLGGKPVEILKRIREPLPKLRTDLAKVNQVLFLLLDNAAKFTPQGQIEIAVEVEGDRLRCAITDTGIGICADDMQFVFDEFYQVDPASSNRYRGSGLGLTLVRDLVALLGGEVQLRSEIGRGTRVAFEVPVDVI